MLQRSESVTMAFLVLLETLSPEERAVFLLKEVFEYDHAEIAEMLEMSASNSRQLLHRAKQRLAEGRPRASGNVASRRALAERFARAFSTGDGPELGRLLGAEVGLWADGGGKALAARRPLAGREAVQKFLLGLHRTAEGAGLLRDLSIQLVDVNGEPAVLLRQRGVVDSVFVLSTDGDTINGIRVVRNPDKLLFIDRQLSVVH
jgi:hypothetical protein